MANRAVSLIWIAKTGSGWKRFPVLIAKNGRVRTGVVLEDGVEKSYPDGRFQVRCFQGSKTVYENAGTDPTEALGVRDRLGRRKNVVAQAEEAGLEIRTEETRQCISPTVIRYLKRLEEMEAYVAAKTYAVALHSFQRLVPELEFIDQINEAALLRFTAALRKAGNSPRTVANKHRAVTGMMRWAGIDVPGLRLVKPRFEKKIASTYSDAEVTALRGTVADDPYYQTVIDVLRMTGLREGEAVHLQWGMWSLIAGSSGWDPSLSSDIPSKIRKSETLPFQMLWQRR